MALPPVTAPGIYELPAAIYHGNCTPAPAMSAGFAWRMMQSGGCPAKAWFGSSLNPNHKAEHKAVFDIGSAAHLLFLEPHLFDASVHIVGADDWRSKAAKEERDAARGAGKIPLLTHQAFEVLAMRRALRNELQGLPFATAPRFADDAFRGGKAEQSYFWRDDEHGVWLKCRPDYAKPGHVIDYKTSASAEPGELSRIAANMGWHLRAAMYLEGHERLTGERATYWYVVQEKEAPHLVTVAKLDGEALEWGAHLLRAAKARFADGLHSGRWPGYAEQAVIVGLPQWERYSLQDRHDAGEFDPARYITAAPARAALPAPIEG